MLTKGDISKRQSIQNEEITILYEWNELKLTIQKLQDDIK